MQSSTELAPSGNDTDVMLGVGLHLAESGFNPNHLGGGLGGGLVIINSAYRVVITLTGSLLMVDINPAFSSNVLHQNRVGSVDLTDPKSLDDLVDLLRKYVK